MLCICSITRHIFVSINSYSSIGNGSMPLVLHWFAKSSQQFAWISGQLFSLAGGRLPRDEEKSGREICKCRAWGLPLFASKYHKVSGWIKLKMSGNILYVLAFFIFDTSKLIWHLCLTFAPLNSRNFYINSADYIEPKYLGFSAPNLIRYRYTYILFFI